MRSWLGPQRACWKGKRCRDRNLIPVSLPQRSALLHSGRRIILWETRLCNCPSCTVCRCMLVARQTEGSGRLAVELGGEGKRKRRTSKPGNEQEVKLPQIWDYRRRATRLKCDRSTVRHSRTNGGEERSGNRGEDADSVSWMPALQCQLRHPSQRRTNITPTTQSLHRHRKWYIGPQLTVARREVLGDTTHPRRYRLVSPCCCAKVSWTPLLFDVESPGTAAICGPSGQV
jgi:hypothetical protein